MTRAEALAAFERDLERRGRAAGTIKLLLGTARRFLDRTREPVSKFTTGDVRRYLAGREREGVAPSTHAGELRHLRSFFRALVEADVFAASPADGLSVKTPPERVEIPLSSDAVARLLVAALEEPERQGDLARAVSLRDRATIELLYGLGLRAGEVAGLNVVDIHLADGVVMVRREKRGENGFMPLPPSAVPHLSRYLVEARPALLADDGRDGGALLVAKGGGRLTNGGVWRIVRSVARRAGLSTHPHALRHSIASELVRSGVTVPLIQRFLGHRRISSTQGYLNLSLDDLRRAVEALEHE